MSLTTLLNIAGMPGMDLAVSLAVDLGVAVQNVKIYRTQCKDLSIRCTRLLIAFREKCSGLEGTELMAAADEVSAIIERAHKKAQNWAAMSRIKSFVYQGDIKNGLEQLYRDIDLCAQQFSIASSAELHKGHRELQAIRERDNAENREILQNILQSVDGLKDVLALSEPSAVQHIMQTIQEELQQQTVQPDQQRDLQQGLYEIHRRTQYLPPMIDLTGQVEKTSEQPVAYGAYNDVYTGLWLNEEKVALKFARAINHTAKARKRFHKEVEIWRDLQHPHISRLYGIVYFGVQIYSVSAWMGSGSALDYINSSDEVINRLKIIGDVASGMEYLHRRNVVHGDLRAANILIDDTGRACVSDFGLSKVIEEVAPEMSSTTHGDSPVRWQARELVTPDDYKDANGGANVDVICVSQATDVWSLGMLCLEIMTGNRPYQNRPRDANVIADLVAKILPERPTDEAVIARGLDDHLWNLTLHCWRWEPLERPTMAAIRAAIRSLPAHGGTGAHGSPHIFPSNSFSESPKPLNKDLPLAGGSSPAVQPSISRTSLSPPIPRKPSNPSRPSTAPIGSAESRDYGFGRLHSSSISSINPNIQTSVPRHRPPVSSGTVSSPPINSLTGGALGLNIRHRPSQGSFQDATPSLWESFRPPPTNPRVESRNGSLSNSSSLGTTPSSGLSITLPIRFSASDLLQSPPLVHVENSDGEVSAASSSFSSSFDLPSGRRPSLPGGPSSAPYTPSRNGLLYSPPSKVSGERSDSDSISSSFPSSVDSPLRPLRSASYPETGSPRSSLVDFADLDCASVIHLNKDGSVKAGSLAGLVDRLIKDTPGAYGKDQEFRETFLSTYRLFSTSRDILKLLIRRYVIASTDESIRVEDKVATRFLVLIILKQWLKGHYAKGLEFADLEDLKIFLKEITTPPAFYNSARELITTIDSLLNYDHGPRVLSPTFSTTSDRRSIRASDITPTGLAIALAILEGGKYSAITATDCVSYLLHKNGANKVSEARATNNKIVNWVKKSVIRSDRMENRGDTLRFFVNTAAECRKLHNYTSMSAILAGIDSQTILRLKLTRGCLDKQMREMQKKLSGILDPGHNHRAYRDILPNPKKGPCLPWLAVHLKDLQGVFEHHPRQTTVDHQSLVNFDKYKHVQDSIADILAFQLHAIDSTQIERERKAGPLSYLEEQLAGTQLGQAAEDKLESRSLDLQKQEDRDYEHRVNELAAVGFRTTRGRG